MQALDEEPCQELEHSEDRSYKERLKIAVKAFGTALEE